MFDLSCLCMPAVSPRKSNTKTFSSQHKPCCHDEGRENSLNYISASPLLVIPASLRWPCEPRAWAAGRWDLPLGWVNSVLKVAAGCRDVLMTFKNVKSGRWQTTLCLLSALPRESESASLDQKVKRKKKEVTSASLSICWIREKKKKNGLTAPPLGPLSAHVTWVHYCWPGWKT